MGGRGAVKPKNLCRATNGAALGFSTVALIEAKRRMAAVTGVGNLFARKPARMPRSKSKMGCCPFCFIKKLVHHALQCDMEFFHWIHKPTFCR
jgi:hypothetical protein